MGLNKSPAILPAVYNMLGLGQLLQTHAIIPGEGRVKTEPRVKIARKRNLFIFFTQIAGNLGCDIISVSLEMRVSYFQSYLEKRWQQNDHWKKESSKKSDTKEPLLMNTPQPYDSRVQGHCF